MVAYSYNLRMWEVEARGPDLGYLKACLERKGETKNKKELSLVSHAIRRLGARGTCV